VTKAFPEARRRLADRQVAFQVLLESVPLTPALLAQLVRDPDVCGAGGGFAWASRELTEIWRAPAEYLEEAFKIAALLARCGAPRSLVLPVLIAEADGDLEMFAPGWRGWRESIDAHESIRAILAEFKRVEEWEPDVLHELLDAIEGSPLPDWDGVSPRSLDEYAADPGDFHPSLACAFVERAAELFAANDEFCDDPASQGARAVREERLNGIELAAHAALNCLPSPAHGARTDSATDVAAQACDHASEIDEEGALVGGDLEMDDQETSDAEHARADAQERLAAAWPSLSARERAFTIAELTLIGQGITPTARAITLALGDGSTPAAVRQLKRRRDEHLRSLAPQFSAGRSIADVTLLPASGG
jgi:hypothetical protein